jgi:2-dehydropantoate 2-reductase
LELWPIWFISSFLRLPKKRIADQTVNADNMNVVVYGTGGVGGYFGARLSDSGCFVHFIARGAHLKAIQEKGLFLKSISGDLHLRNVSVSSSSSEIPFKQIDLVLFCTKTFQLREASEEIRSFVHEETLILPLLNGIENSEILLEYFRESQVLGGLCRIISKIENPGVITHIDVDPSIVFGPLDGQTNKKTLSLQTVFQSARIKSTLSKNIQREIWSKFLFISSISALGGLVGKPIGVLRKGYLRDIISKTGEEIANLALACGIDLGDDIITKQLAIVDRQDPKTTASLQRDIMEGRPSELEAQNGAVVRMSKSKGLTSPYNEMIYELLKARIENF